MFISYTNKNKYGGYTHEIEFTPILVLRFTEMDTTTVQIEFLEKRILFKDKVFLTLISHGSLSEAVMKSFNMLLFPPKPLPFERDLEAIDRLKDDVLKFMFENSENIAKNSIVKF